MKVVLNSYQLAGEIENTLEKCKRLETLKTRQRRQRNASINTLKVSARGVRLHG